MGDLGSIPGFDPWVGKIPWRREWLPTPVFFPGESPWTKEPGGLQFIGSQRVSWTERSSHLILKEINPDYSLEGLMLKLKLQYFGHLMQRIESLERTLMLGKIEGRRRRG